MTHMDKYLAKKGLDAYADWALGVHLALRPHPLLHHKSHLTIHNMLTMLSLSRNLRNLKLRFRIRSHRYIDNIVFSIYNEYFFFSFILWSKYLLYVDGQSAKLWLWLSTYSLESPRMCHQRRLWQWWSGWWERRWWSGWLGRNFVGFLDDNDFIVYEFFFQNMFK
jgi:hypothetical protein